MMSFGGVQKHSSSRRFFEIYLKKFSSLNFDVYYEWKWLFFINDRRKENFSIQMCHY